MCKITTLCIAFITLRNEPDISYLLLCTHQEADEWLDICGIHVAPAKAKLTDQQTDRRSDPYVALRFAGATKSDMMMDLNLTCKFFICAEWSQQRWGCNDGA